MEELNYEKLDVYRCAMELLAQVHLLLDKLSKGFSHLADQLRRSCLSIPLNIAEGSGKSSPQERMRFFEIARASALECSAIINCCITLKLTDKDLLAHIRTLLFRIVQMLSKLSPKARIASTPPANDGR
jgi:four helix bundle protein